MITDGSGPHRTAAASLRASHWPSIADLTPQSQMFFVVSVSSTLQSTASNNTGRADEWLGDSSARKFSRLTAEQQTRKSSPEVAPTISVQANPANNCWFRRPWLKGKQELLKISPVRGLTVDSSRLTFVPTSKSRDNKARPNIKNLARSNLDIVS